MSKVLKSTIEKRVCGGKGKEGKGRYLLTLVHYSRNPHLYFKRPAGTSASNNTYFVSANNHARCSSRRCEYNAFGTEGHLNLPLTPLSLLNNPNYCRNGVSVLWKFASYASSLR